MIERPLRELWESLLGKAPHFPQFLRRLRLQGIRGIDDLTVDFTYPVTVIAGENASGKSTLLFAAACAYRVPGAGPRDFVPSSLFPACRPKTGRRGDERKEIVLDYDYSTPEDYRSMRWRYSSGWNRSFFRRPRATQPTRAVYLSTLANLTHPSEVRSILSRSRPGIEPAETPLTASQIEFAQELLPFRYGEVVDLSLGNRRLLYAVQEGGPQYSELQMAAGERAILRLSQALAQLDDALVLIDEVEVGLHPWIQQLLMLQLQRLALRRGLQILVTTHSPVVLDSVPSYGRVFLERRRDGRVRVAPPYRDMVQNALYGRSVDALNFLCEDEVAEALLDGIFDNLLLRQDIRRESVRVGRDTGAAEFPTHAAAFRKFGRIRDFVFILDGDQRGGAVEEKIRAASGDRAVVLYLTGGVPEVWVWKSISRHCGEIAAELNVTVDEFRGTMDRADSIYAQASDGPGEIAKSKLRQLAGSVRRRVPEICRLVSRIESARRESDMQPLAERLGEALERWRAQRDEWR